MRDWTASRKGWIESIRGCTLSERKSSEQERLNVDPRKDSKHEKLDIEQEKVHLAGEAEH
jgi:hypothetical protein